MCGEKERLICENDKNYNLVCPSEGEREDDAMSDQKDRHVTH